MAVLVTGDLPTYSMEHQQELGVKPHVQVRINMVHNLIRVEATAVA